MLYKSLGLTARQAAKVVAEIVEMVDRRMRDDEMLKNLKEKFSGNELLFAAFTLGRIVGMSFAIRDSRAAESIISDFGRYLKIYREKGRGELERVVAEEILEETYREIEKVRDAV
ncbi:MAG: hypothetical protein ABWW66_05020 [Archaeoglobaceae archaeon]